MPSAVRPQPPLATAGSGRRTRRTALAFGSVGVALSLALGGCGLRLETPPPPLPSPDAAEAARQAAALREVGLADLAEEAAGRTGVGALDQTLTDVAAGARAHAAALGGIWEPPSWATEPADGAAPGAPGPGGTEGPGATDGTGVDSEAPSSGVPEPAAVLAAAAEAARLTCADAVAVDPADLAALLAAICLAGVQTTADLAEDLGAEAPGDLLPAAPGPAGIDPASQLAEALTGVGGAVEVARTLDAAGYTLEVAAARSAGDERSSLVDRAEQARRTAHAVVVGAGALGSPEDPRRAAYDLPGAGDADPRALAAQAEAATLAAWGAVVGEVSPAARPTVLAEMAATAAWAQAWGAPSSDFPGLPEIP